MLLGLKNTYKSVRSANGPAQMLTYSFWGILMAGMLWNVCQMCITPIMLTTWGAVSVLVAYATVWMDKKWLRNILLVDTALSTWILAILVFHEPHAVNPVYYSFSVDGMASRSVASGGHSVSEWFHILSLLWMSFHGIYLADLTNRQILEKQRFQE